MNNEIIFMSLTGFTLQEYAKKILNEWEEEENKKHEQSNSGI